ncbi:MAG: RNA 2',3'-cyclic phosphodiesterase [Promethearchaeota archaeon]
MIRSFIAFELKNSNTIEKIQAFSERLIKNQPRLKLVEPQNLHLTVKFLGSIHESTAKKIYKILKLEINEKIFQNKDYEFRLRGVGQFNQFSVIWIKLIGDIPFLQKIKDQVENLLKTNLNIEKDRRTKFKPHLTIGRLRKNRINYKNFESLKRLINENKELDFGIFTISQIKLKESNLTPKGPIYKDLIYED